MYGCFDSINWLGTINYISKECMKGFRVHTCIEAVLPKLLGQFHEITLDKFDAILKAGFDCVPLGATKLEIIVVDTGDEGICELGDLTSRTTHPATNVQDPHTGFDVHLVRKVMLVAGNLRENITSTNITRKMSLPIGKMIRLGKNGKSERTMPNPIHIVRLRRHNTLYAE